MKNKTKKEKKQNGPAGKGHGGEKQTAGRRRNGSKWRALPVPSLMLWAFSFTTLSYLFCSLISLSSQSLS